MHLYFFDLDKTLYTYDFRRRLPELSRLSGASQYALAKRWWAGGYEVRAEAGELPTVDEYLDEFARVTGGRRLSVDEWADARALAMTAIDGSLAALQRAAELGTVCLLSNNPAPLAAALPRLAPEASRILGPNVLVSYMLGCRKPEPQLFHAALARFDARPEEAFFVDDAAANVEGARAVGMSAHQLRYVEGVPQTAELAAAIEEFAAR